MPFRVTVNGVTIETDTVEEALSLADHTKDGGAVPRVRHRPRRTPKPTLKAVFDNGYRPVLDLLLEGPVDTTKLAASIGKEPKSLPPIVRAWRARARLAGHDFDTLLKIERSSDGRTAVYTLTDEGRRIFSAFTQP